LLPAIRVGGQSKVERSPEPVADDAPTIRVSGVVVNPAGKPIEGAPVILRARRPNRLGYQPGLRNAGDVLARTTTDAAGRFAFDKIGIPLRYAELIHHLLEGNGGVEVLTWADGMGLAWYPLDGLTRTEPVQLKLAPEAKVSGVVRGPDGRGLPDVRVSFLSATRGTGEWRLDGAEPPRDLDLFLSAVSISATTDAEGRFDLHHVPAEHRASVAFEGNGVGRNFRFVETRAAMKDKEVPSFRGDPTPVLRSPIALELKPQRAIRIKVTDHLGQPVTDGGLYSYSAKSGFSADLDKNGEASGPNRGPGSLTIHYHTDPWRPRITTSVKVEIKDAEDTAVVEIRLPQSTWLSGAVVDADTGKPIVGAYIQYQRETDPKSKDAPRVGSLAVSGQDGNFRLPVTPGAGHVGFEDSLFGYYVPERRKKAVGVKIDVPKSGEPAPLKLVLTRGLAIRGIIRDEAGKPVAGALVAPSDSHDEPGMAVSKADGRFELFGLPPRDAVKLRTVGPFGVAETTIAAAPDHPADKTRWHDVELRLKTGVALTGRVLYDGKPRPGVTFSVYTYQADQKGMTTHGHCKTDAQGRYKIAGLEPGVRFQIDHVEDPDGLLFLKWQHRGLFGTVSDKQPEIQLADINLVAGNQVLRGVVVDPKGKPVAGAKIIPRLADGMPLSYQGKDGMPWANTDKEGRFELSGLPGQPVTLMAFMALGKKIRNPVNFRTTLNQQDVRMVLDPTLGVEVEDLDTSKGPKTPKKQ
jgi:hypothetical protein